jgi:exodeoxyribonuclease V alpha subunit
MPAAVRVEHKQEPLAGLVERVTFHSEDSGFCVLRVKVRGRRELVTLVGHTAAISAGEWVQASGSWVVDRAHGQQFKAHFPRPPRSPAWRASAAIWARG